MRISIMQMFRQVKKDLTGKDTINGYQPSYSWMANQLSHFGMGFVLTYFLIWAVNSCICKNLFYWHLAAYIVASSIWTIMELIKTIKEIKKQKNNGVFKPNTGYIWKDEFVDIGFFLFGTTTAFLGFLFNAKALLEFLGVFILLFLPIMYVWIGHKMYFQQAGLPFFWRLSNIISPLTPIQVETISNFAKNKGETHVILIFGGKQTGKTSLATAIGTDRAIYNHVVRYYPFVKYLDAMELDNNQLYNPNIPDQQWPWREADILIIDDINPSGSNFLVTPAQFQNSINARIDLHNNLDSLKNKRSVWVCGDDYSNKHYWENEFKNIGIISDPEKEILSIELLK